MELTIAKILRYGVLIAGFFILKGWMTQIQFNENIFLSFHQFTPEPLTVTLRKLFAEKNVGMLTAYVGLFILISLPLIRVLMTAFLFIKQKEYTLAAMASVVLVGLLLSFALGFQL